MRGDVLRRAKTAFYREAVRCGELHPPPITTAGLIAYQGTAYVLLRTPDALLAVYKVLPCNGTLQRQHHWPQALEECVEHSSSR